MAEGMTGWMYGTPPNTGEFSGNPARAAAAFPPWASWAQGPVPQWPPHQAPHGPFPSQTNAPSAQMYTQPDRLTAGGDATRFAFGDDQVPGLQPIGYGAPLPALITHASTSGVAGVNPRDQGEGVAQMQAGGTPDFAFFDDASSLLSLFPPYSGSG
ncbi:hypothetical protein BD413DRAFT_305578 [Trametes elegans]|nr:hypothetical protein BD413DRAFT_305578 [Trametes elegans]